MSDLTGTDTGTNSDTTAEAGDRKPLAVPPGALDVDLTQSFQQLIFRAAKSKRLRDNDARDNENTQRELLNMLIEVDDTLAALETHPELQRVGGDLGIGATRRRLLGKLATLGVKPMRVDGLFPDPQLTRVAATESRPDAKPDTVVRTIVTGYLWNEVVLRRAQVVIADAASTVAEAVTMDEPGAEAETEPVAAVKKKKQQKKKK